MRAIVLATALALLTPAAFAAGGATKSGASAAPAASAGPSAKQGSENCGTPDEFKACPPMPRHPMQTYPAHKKS